MKIAVDTMGTDNRPAPDVAGAVMAAREYGVSIVLVGDESLVVEEMAKHNIAGLDIEVLHASEDIKMTDKPAESAKEKSDSSIHKGLSLIKNGSVDAFVSMGNTGAVLAVALLHSIGRIRGIKRPALTAIVPTLKEPMILADIGANTDCKPEYLVQFAQMADIYARRALGYENPRVALLSNGEEEGKGNQLVKETTLLLKEVENLNFTGNAEPKILLRGEVADIVIHDGFAGNVMIKAYEGALRAMKDLIKEEISSGPLTAIGGLLAKPAFTRVGERLSEETIGGAPLLGVAGVVIIGHGSSSALAIRNAILRAKEAVDGKVVEAITEGVS